MRVRNAIAICPSADCMSSGVPTCAARFNPKTLNKKHECCCAARRGYAQQLAQLRGLRILRRGHLHCMVIEPKPLKEERLPVALRGRNAHSDSPSCADCASSSVATCVAPTSTLSP